MLTREPKSFAGLPDSAPIRDGLLGWRPGVVWARRHESGAWLVILHREPWKTVGGEIEPCRSALIWSKRADYRCRDQSSPLHYGKHSPEKLAAKAAEEWASGPPKHCVPTKIDRKGLGMQPIDRGQRKVYKWEDLALGVFESQELTREEIKELVGRVFKALDIGRVPDVHFTKQRRGAASCMMGTLLSFGPSCMRRDVVLHECAHSVISYRHFRHRLEDRLKSHGPEFVATYIELLADFGGRDEGELRASAKANKIRVAPAGMARAFTPPGG